MHRTFNCLEILLLGASNDLRMDRLWNILYSGREKFTLKGKSKNAIKFDIGGCIKSYIL